MKIQFFLPLFRPALWTASRTTAAGISTLPCSFFLPFPDLSIVFFVPNLELLHCSGFVK
jgi:hypothetical protein